MAALVGGPLDRPDCVVGMWPPIGTGGGARIGVPFVARADCDDGIWPPMGTGGGARIGVLDAIVVGI